MRVLIVEDDGETIDFLSKALREAGYQVTGARDGAEGLYLALTEAFDLLILDRMLPGLDGLTLLETARKAGKTMPVLILSALADVDDRVGGLRRGGDDYLCKPFALAELLARAEVLLRRGGKTIADDTMRVADLEVQPRVRGARRGGRPLGLQPREYQLLEYLARNAGAVVTRTMLLNAVWGYDFDPQTNVIDVHISRLRQKVDKGFAVPLIATVRGAGYMLRAPD